MTMEKSRETEVISMNIPDDAVHSWKEALSADGALSADEIALIIGNLNKTWITLKHGRKIEEIINGQDSYLFSLTRKKMTNEQKERLRKVLIQNFRFQM